MAALRQPEAATWDRQSGGLPKRVSSPNFLGPR